MYVSILAAPVIDSSGFTPLPTWMIVGLPSLLFIWLLRHKGKQYAGKLPYSDNVPTDIVVDIAVLLCAASLVAAAGTTPLISSLSVSVNTRLTSDSGISTPAGTLTIGVAMFIIMVIAGFAYTRSETKKTLAIFALLLFSFSVASESVSTVLGWWVNYPLQWGWDFVMWIINGVAGVRINF